MKPRLILASTSPYRASLLARLGLTFSIATPGISEAEQPGEPARDRALRLAHAKAAAVAMREPEAWVLGSDQVAVCQGLIHDKPGNAERCRMQLRASSGQGVLFYTAVVMLRGEPAVVHEHVDCTTVRFRRLDDDEIARYVERDRPFDCAGGFRSEGLGVMLFDSVESRDPTALVGLPLMWVAAALRAAGLDPLAADQR